MITFISCLLPRITLKIHICVGMKKLGEMTSATSCFVVFANLIIERSCIFFFAAVGSECSGARDRR